MDITNGLTLSSAVKDRNAPLRRFLESRLPNTRAITAEYKAGSGPLLVDSLGAPAGTIGTAMDLIIRFLLDPNDVPQSARKLFPLSDVYLAVVDELSARAGAASSTGQLDQLVRASWGLALGVEAFRSGNSYPSLVVDLHRRHELTADILLEQASADAVTEMSALVAIAQTRLIPQLPGPFSLGPEFGPSKREGLADTRLIAAEADLIANGLLLDIKTALGVKNVAGIRKDTLKPEHLYQLVAYALLDESDEYKLDRIGLYSARYGGLSVWPLGEALNTMAGDTVELSDLRAEISNMLHRRQAPAGP